MTAVAWPGQGFGVGGEQNADSRAIKEMDSTGFGEKLACGGRGEGRTS